MFLCSHCLPLYTTCPPPLSSCLSSCLYPVSVCPRKTNLSTHTSLLPTCARVTLRVPPVRSGWACSPRCSRCWPRLRGELSNSHAYNSAQGCGHKHTATSAKSSRKAETCQGCWGRAEPQTQQNLRREVSAAPGTSHLKPALPNPPTSNTPTPTPMASEWRVAVCTHRKQCLVQGLLRPPNLIPSPQQQRPLRKEARTSSRLASEPPTRLDLHPKPQRSRGSWESPVLSLTPEVQSVSSEIYQQEKKNTWEGDGGSSVYEGEFLSPPAAPWPWGGEKASLPAGT